MKKQLKVVSDSEATKFWDAMQEFITYLSDNNLKEYKDLVFTLLEDNIKLQKQLEGEGYDLKTGTRKETESSTTSDSK